MDIDAETFKDCASCSTTWYNREEFLADPDITYVGYQAHFEDLSAGMFLFNHSCGNTLALLTGDFTGLYSGPIFRENKSGSDECPGYCLNEQDVRPCPVECECAYVREIIQKVTRWPKCESQES